MTQNKNNNVLKFVYPPQCPTCGSSAWEINKYAHQRQFLHRIDDITYEVVGEDELEFVEIFCKECDEWKRINT